MGNTNAESAASSAASYAARARRGTGPGNYNENLAKAVEYLAKAVQELARKQS